MELTYKSIKLDDFHVKSEGDERSIEGYASVFNHKDSDEEIVLPGAFKSSLEAELPLMLYQHKRDRIPGVWKEAREDSKGLFIKGNFIDSTLGRDVYEEARSGAIREFSIGFRAKKESYDRQKSARMLHEVLLKEVSLVTFAANNQAKITRVKSLDGKFLTEREFEEFLRDVGELSHKEAKIVLSDGYKALLKHRDGGEGELDKLFQLLTKTS